jgi:hypothetical protein
VRACACNLNSNRMSTRLTRQKQKHMQCKRYIRTSNCIWTRQSRRRRIEGIRERQKKRLPMWTWTFNNWKAQWGKHAPYTVYWKELQLKTLKNSDLTKFSRSGESLTNKLQRTILSLIIGFAFRNDANDDWVKVE